MKTIKRKIRGVEIRVSRLGNRFLAVKITEGWRPVLLLKKPFLMKSFICNNRHLVVKRAGSFFLKKRITGKLIYLPDFTVTSSFI